MKKNEIDLKTVKILIERQQFIKLCKCIKERQLDKEAALECFNHSEVIRAVVDNYTFEELFDGNLVKFVEDGHYFLLRNFVNIETSNLWMNCFFKNSEELLKVNDYVKENHPGETIKDIIMPHRECTKSYGSFKDDYYNCIDGIEEILMEREREKKCVTAYDIETAISHVEAVASDRHFTTISTAGLWTARAVRPIGYINPSEITEPTPAINDIDWGSYIDNPSKFASEYSHEPEVRLSNKNKPKTLDMLEAMPILKWSIVEKYIEKLDLSEKEVETMLENRFYFFRACSLVDLEGVISILDGFKGRYDRDISVNSLTCLINPTVLDLEETTIEGKALIYNKYMRDRIDLNDRSSSRRRDLKLNALAFEKDETKVNRIFDSLLDDVGILSISNHMKKVFDEYKYSVLITEHMFNLTANSRYSIDYILFPDVQLSVDEVIDFIEVKISKLSLLDTCYNPFALRAIQLDTYSEEDMKKLSPYLNLNRLNSYFKDNFIPFDFTMKYVTKVDDLRLRSANANKYTAEQLVTIIESDIYTSDKYNNQGIFTNFLIRKDVTDELFARAIAAIGETNRDGEYGMVKSKSNTSVKNILTLLN